MKALGLGVLTGILLATIAASLFFSLTDTGQPVPAPPAVESGVYQARS
ncbi:hypothetical protein ITP53_13895 [Nonomuraea sp. K274]|uniref:DUF2613 family protein n=1 Tax=Nonomuraea cypriaca TaxID=1187855 RepID=A0A931EY05_9ACTN|nr:hypothetical protein [Nonomuraea cypriaca]MBF8186815.1 hypothetical protein [Nonomuraea cypriaca]